MLRLFLLFTLVPVIELALLIRIGTWLGPLPTIAIVFATGLVGAFLAKREGFAVLRQLRDELREGVPPGARLVEGALVVVGGVLLITPGVFTDLAGFALIFGPVRRRLAPVVLDWGMKRFRPIQIERPEPKKPHFDHPVR